jgi:transcriptional regulator with XRE-family HTH domain
MGLSAHIPLPEGRKKTTMPSITNDNSRLADKLRHYRVKAGLTQTDAARVSGVKREYISSIELGRIQVLYPGVFNALRRAYRFPGFEILEAEGYTTDAHEADINDGLITLIRALTPEQQEGVAAIIKATFRFSTAVAS